MNDHPKITIPTMYMTVRGVSVSLTQSNCGERINVDIRDSSQALMYSTSFHRDVRFVYIAAWIDEHVSKRENNDAD